MTAEGWPPDAELSTDGMGYVVMGGRRQPVPIRRAPTPPCASGFHKGDRVRLTADGIRCFPRSTTRHGVVSAEPRRNGHTVMVTADGSRTARSWGRLWWELGPADG